MLRQAKGRGLREFYRGKEKTKKTWKKGEREAAVPEGSGWERKLVRP